MQIIEIIGVAIWLMLPAYITNASAAFFGGKTPIDRRVYLCKNRLLGDGKTYEGFLKGLTCGFAFGVFQSQIGEWFEIKPTFGLFPSFLVTLLCLCLGALFGDIIGSFIKRRMGLKRRTPLPIVDQLDFVFGAFLLLFLFVRSWFLEIFTLEIFIAIVSITLFLHPLTNYIGFKIGKKKVPW